MNGWPLLPDSACAGHEAVVHPGSERQCTIWPWIVYLVVGLAAVLYAASFGPACSIPRP
jgi:hypothetical protein